MLLRWSVYPVIAIVLLDFLHMKVKNRIRIWLNQKSAKNTEKKRNKKEPHQSMQLFGIMLVISSPVFLQCRRILGWLADTSCRHFWLQRPKHLAKSLSCSF